VKVSSTLLLLGIFALGSVAVAVVVWAMVGSGEKGRRRLAALGATDGGGAEVSVAPGGVRSDAVPSLSRVLDGTPFAQQLQLELIRAGWLLRASEFVALCVGVGAVACAVGALLTHSLAQGMVLGGGAAAAVPYMVLKSRQQRRAKMLTQQLPDALDMLSGSLRSGFSLLRAMQVVRAQMHPPIAEEFGRVVDEVQYGIPLELALDNLVARTASYDLELIVSAVQTQLAVGGNLAEIFDSIAEMIRERVRLLGELQAATAEGRLSAGILLAMPFVMAFLVNIMSPGYLAPLFKTQLGLIMVGMALLLMGFGAIVMRKLIDIDV
jgi:tight adherence protein B